MRLTLIAALCAFACAGPTAAVAQDEDDWEFQHEASMNQTVAAVRYDAGVAIVVQCRDRALSAALIGMPAGVGGLEVQARRADGRTDLQTWAPGPQPGILMSSVPARDIRFMRGGGLYSVRTAEGAPRALPDQFRPADPVGQPGPGSVGLWLGPDRRPGSTDPGGPRRSQLPRSGCAAATRAPTGAWRARRLARAGGTDGSGGSAAAGCRTPDQLRLAGSEADRLPV